MTNGPHIVTRSLLAYIACSVWYRSRLTPGSADSRQTFTSSVRGSQLIVWA